MKAKYLFLAGLSVMMLGACSSDDVVDSGRPDNDVAEGTEGYVSFRINLPQAQNVSTKAVSFDDGDASEYYVNDATLLLFAGATEAAATFQSAYDLKTIGFAGEGSSTDQITSKATITQKITKPGAEAGANLYAMIVLNDNGLIDVAGDNTATFDGENLGGKNLAWFTTTASTKTAAELTGNGFFMINAPLASKQGGSLDPSGATVQTLAPVDQSKIYTTAAAAGNDPAAVIYVERAVAKVTVTKADNPAASANPNVEGYEIKNWILDNTNKKSYIVRNMTGVSDWFGYKNAGATIPADAYRFVGGSLVGPDVKNANWYRTYFAIDPNFGADVTSEDLATIGGQTFEEADVTGLEVGSHGYCLDNVFDVARMKEKNTTRVIVATQLKINSKEEGADFYTFNDNTSVIYDIVGVQNEVKRIAIEWLGRNKEKWLEPKAPAKEYEVDGDDLTVNVPTTTGGYIQNDITISVTLPAEAQMKGDKTVEQLQDAMKEEVVKRLTLGYYKGGIAYYPVLVKHFGDEQTPWTLTPDKVTNSYPGGDAENNWLGRYGVLRNNWYKINVKGVKNIGSPEVPTVTDRWDDPTDSYMSVEINVLSWAVRTQDVEL